MAGFMDFINGAINSAINNNDKDSFFKVACLLSYADTDSASKIDIELSTELYNTIFLMNL